MRCPNYKLKSIVLLNHDDVLVRKYDYLNYKNTDFIKGIDIESAYIELISKCGLNYIRECRRVYNASYKRVNRLKDRIESYLLEGNCIFVTLTFTDSVLSTTSLDTRRQYVRKYLKSQCKHFVANIDYGGKKGREHYHALVVCDRLNLSWWHQHCGNTNCEIIKRLDTASVKLAKYVSKLTNHAIKDTTKRQCYIYSR